MSQVTHKEKRTNKSFWPVIGFVFAIVFGVLGFFMAPSTVTLVENVYPDFNRNMLPVTEMQLYIGFGVIVALLLMVLSAMIIAIAEPKRAMHVKETDIAKERKAERERVEKAKVRRRTLAKQAKREMRDKDMQ